MQAAYWGYKDILVMLIAAGANVNYQNSTVSNHSFQYLRKLIHLIKMIQLCRTALMYASHSGKQQIVSILINSGALLNLKDSVSVLLTKIE